MHARTDLYVKALILMGFGTLAVAGAVMDSRPDPVVLPDVPSPLVSSSTASVFTDVSVPGLPAEVSDGVSLTLAAPRALTPRPRPRVVLASMDEASGRPPAPVMHPAVLPAVATPGISDLAFTEVVLSPAPRLDAPAPMVERAPESVVAMNQDDEGFFSGMLRRTSASVGRTGASVSSSVSTSVGRAGSSLAGAIRFVSDTVKRAF